jgi:hypothetical protein
VNSFGAPWLSDDLYDRMGNPAPVSEIILGDAVLLHLLQLRPDDAHCVRAVLLHYPSSHHPGIAIHGAGYDRPG